MATPPTACSLLRHARDTLVWCVGLSQDGGYGENMRVPVTEPGKGRGVLDWAGLGVSVTIYDGMECGVGEGTIVGGWG
jgi:hypothetical protein